MLAQGFAGPRDLKIIYSPLHGVGASAVLPVLAADGFTDVELFGPHAEPDGDFPNVPGHVSNPENPAVFDAIIARAKQAGADLILATDPDCDRIGLAAPLTTEAGQRLGDDDRQPDRRTVDRISCSERRKAAGRLTPRALRGQDAGHDRNDPPHRRRLRREDVWQSAGRLQIHRRRRSTRVGPSSSCSAPRSRTAIWPAPTPATRTRRWPRMLLAELAAKVKAAGQTLHEKLDALYWQYGYHAERRFR